MGILRDTTTPAAQCRQQTELVLSLAELTDTQIRVDQLRLSGTRSEDSLLLSLHFAKIQMKASVLF